MINIPQVPKEDREQIEIGCHNIPIWMLYTLGVVIIAGIITGLIFN